jgi:DNA adenine methylase
MVNHLHFASRSRPFLKWAGGKTQLLAQFSKRLPSELNNGEITQYVEPFVGGGAVFFYLNQRYHFSHCAIFDVNEELILSYRVIKKSIKKLIDALESLESQYLLRDDEDRKLFYYKVRDEFNRKKPNINFKKYNTGWIERAAQTIFLNHTCYNGLYRVNQNGEFNVPFGRYQNPQIFNKDNLNDVAKALKKTTIVQGDFAESKKLVNHKTFIYIDPPYRPLNTTSSFTSYSSNGFSDEDQFRLADFFKDLDKTGAKIMLSNSDPRNENPSDSYFDELYSDFTIERVPATRSINCNSLRRGKINELIITNYR